jgi:hypothetical protein
MAAACGHGDKLMTMRRLGLVLAIATLGACGPIAYVNQVTRKASDSVEEARAAQADKYAPYYWTRATQYLHQAKVLAAHADFQAANRFGRLADEAGQQAVVEAKAAEKDPSKRPLELQKQIAPAKGGEGEDNEPPAKPVKAPKGGLAPAKDAP